MRKYPRLSYSDWKALSKEERSAYVQLARAESQALHEAAVARRNTPHAFSYDQSGTHYWRRDYVQRNLVTGVSTTQKEYSTGSRQKMRSGVTNPKYRQQIAAGINATTSFSAIDTKIKDKTGQVSVWHTVSGQPRLTTASGGLVMVTPDAGGAGSLAVADQKARTEFYKHLKRAQQEFSGGTFLGELAETARMIRRPYVEIPKLIDAYCNKAKHLYTVPRRQMSLRQRERQLSDAWLTTSFGILPFVSDIQDAAGAFASLLNDKRVKRVVGQGADSEFSSVVIDTYRNPGLGCAVWLTEHRAFRGLTSVRYVGGVEVRAIGPDLSSVPDLSQRFGVGVSDFIPTLYEIMPWSFMLDYFSSLGDVINAWAVSYADVKWQCKTVKVERNNSIEAVINYARTKADTTGHQLTLGHPGSSSSQKKTITRSNPGVVPLPQVQAQFNLSPIKMMNIAALRAQMAQYAKKFFS